MGGAPPRARPRGGGRRAARRLPRRARRRPRDPARAAVPRLARGRGGGPARRRGDRRDAGPRARRAGARVRRAGLRAAAREAARADRGGVPDDRRRGRARRRGGRGRPRAALHAVHAAAASELLDGGAAGEIVAVEHLEPVGWWHQAHSFVRGNWRREDETGPMLLAKCCHDLDWLSYVVGRPCVEVSSFGSPDRVPSRPGAGGRRRALHVVRRRGVVQVLGEEAVPGDGRARRDRAGRSTSSRGRRRSRT